MKRTRRKLRHWLCEEVLMGLCERVLITCDDDDDLCVAQLECVDDDDDLVLSVKGCL